MDGMPMPPKSSTNGTTMMMMGHKMHGMMHMTFFWGRDALILFNGWPAGNTANYLLALFMVFVMSVLIELLSHTRFIEPDSNNMVAGMVQTLLHILRVGLSYLVMLALMSFNGGVFLVAVLGHALGFFLCSSAFKKPLHDKHYDLPPMTC
ncbi:copper transporter [Trifolium repens]|nr:copper transporter [Trifolium repens]